MTNNHPQFFQEVREEISKSMIKHGMSTRQDFINDILSKFEAHLIGLRELMEAKKVKELFVGKTQFEFYKGNVDWVFNDGISTAQEILGQSLLPLKK